MIVQTLDGQQLPWKLPTKKSKARRSKLHEQALKVVQKVLPGTLILEEVGIPVKKNKRLKLDIYLPKFRVAIECQGMQHFKIVKHFQNKKQYYQQRNNDDDKAHWCDLNEITLIYFNFDEHWDTWKTKLNNMLGKTNDT